jgi:putative ABC transport system permease protein
MANHIALIYRYLSKDKWSNTLNILGLSVGLSFILLIISYTEHQARYDSFWPNHENIFRIRRGITYNGEKNTIALIDSKLIQELANVPSIQFATGFIKIQEEILFKGKNVSFVERNGLSVDPNFLNIFRPKLLTGSDQKSLEKPNSIFISQSFARKYFDEVNVIGQSLTISEDGSQKQVLINGVFEDLPTNSSLNFDFLISGSTFSNWKQLQEGYGSPFHAFILTKAKVSNEILNRQLAVLDRQIYPSSDIITEDNVQELDDIHLNSDLLFDFSKTINLTRIKIMVSIGIVLTLITLFNLTGIMFNKILNRQRDYSIFKIYGANKTSLYFQLLIELFFLCEVAFIISFAFTELVLTRAITNLTELNLSLIKNYDFFVYFNLGFFLVASVFTLIYSSLVFRSSNPSLNSIGKHRRVNTFLNARTVILTLQFGTTFSFIVWSQISHSQLNHILHMDLGYDKSKVIYLSHNSNIPKSSWVDLKNKLESSDFFNSVSGSQYRLIGDLNASILQKSNNETIKVMWNRVDYNFLSCLKMKLISGRNFSKSNAADDNSIIINESGWKALGDSTIRQVLFPIINEKNPSTIIGVVKDFHFDSFNKKVEPVVMSLKSDFNKFIYIKSTSSTKESISKIKSIWEKSQIEAPFEFEELDNSFNSTIQNEKVTDKISILFTFSAVILSLFGLAISCNQYISNNRKTFSIRKSLGASYWNLFAQINGFFILYVTVGILLFIPIAYVATDSWLLNYQYRIQFSWGYFIWSFVVILITSCAVNLLTSLRLYSLKIANELMES